MLSWSLFDVTDLRLQHERLTDISSNPDFWKNPEEATEVCQEKGLLEGLLGAIDKVKGDLECARFMLENVESSDQDSLIEVQTLLESVEAEITKQDLRQMFSSPEDKGDAILAINAGAGGLEAEDWTSMLMRMYVRWAESKGFSYETFDLQTGDGGIKSVTLLIKGKYAYGFLKAEIGVHRLIRVSPFDSKSRKQTSFSAVEVVPDVEPEDIKIEIRPEDIKIDTFRAGGKGGQHINKVESAVRITHLESGIIVACQQERSQNDNKAFALKVLKAKLYDRERQRIEAEFEANFVADKMLNGFGSQIRTYTLTPYQLVKDERTEQKDTNTTAFLDGKIDSFIETFLLWNAREKKKKLQKENNL